MRPLLFLLVALASTANAGLIGGPEQAVSAVSYAPPPNQQYPFAAASDRSGFVVVWASAGNGLYASHVSSTGEAKPDSQVRLAEGNATDVSICWSGQAYIVTWIENSALMMATMTGDGGMATTPRKLAAPAYTSSGTLVSNGKVVFLVYATGSTMVVRGMLLDGGGNVIRQNIAMPIPQFDGYGGRVGLPLRLATDGDGFAVFWRSVDYVSPRTIFYAARVSADGNLMGGALPAIGNAGLVDDFAVAYAGGRYVVAALDRSAKGVRRFVVDGATMTATVLPVIDDARFGAQLISDGKEFILYGLDPAAGLYTAKFSGQAEIASPRYTKSSTLISERSTSTPLLWNGSTFFLTWSAGGDVVGVLLDESFNGHASFGIGFGPRQQMAPAIASSPEQSLIVWFEQDSDSWTQAEIRGVRVGAAGALIDREPLTIATGATFSRPAVVFTGAGYFVSWISSEGVIRGRLVNSDGTMAPPNDIGRGRSVAVAASASMIVAVFDDGNINAVRLTPLGERIDATPIVLASARGRAPHVATNGIDFLVVWTEGSSYWQAPSLNLLDILGARLMANGSVDAAAIPIATGPTDDSSPEMASDGRDYLVVYQSNRTIAAKRILSEGQLADSTAKQPGVMIGNGSGPTSVVASGIGYYVGWEQVGFRDDVMVVRTDRSGNPAGDPLVVASSTPTVGSSPSMYPALASGPGQPLLVAYDRVFEDSRSPAVARVFFRVVRGETRRRTIRH